MAQREKRDCYEVLGIARSASADEIKRAFRKQALKHHPDRNPEGPQRTEAEEHFKEAQHAYGILSDPEKRQRFDAYGHAGIDGMAGGQAGFGGFDGFGDLFGNLFGEFFGGGAGFGRGRANRPRRGEDQAQRVVIEFEEAVFGCEKEIEIDRVELCETCEGSRAENPEDVVVCPVCRGTGQEVRAQGFFSLSTTCSSCRGHGKVVKNPCKDCSGLGVVEKTERLQVKIPPGVDSDTRIKLTGQGGAGANSGPPGDLYVLLEVKDHECFRRHRDDIHLEHNISFAQAALGGKVEVNTLEQRETVDLHEGTQTGQTYTLKGFGVPSLHGHGRGDFVVHVRVVTPTKLVAKQKELLKEFAGLGGEHLELPEKSFFQKVRDVFE